ncbi:Htaa protein [Actinocorallia herbida]|uniref:Htaa protein n=1 Tax=Actinocorallia herbida TaxID=58109 RepID=A0A3N1CY54_9ACTN|nr:HtaA domain-containing protein [Actinocorallia herbida]ROO85658.1 Htaa protein [Actinocorallia herbida]
MSTDGYTLTWGVKRSFREYVAEVDDGSETFGNGARRTASGEFAFPLADAADFDPATGLGTLRFAGSVVFRAYSGVLLVRVRDPWVVLGETGGCLTIMHPAYREATGVRAEIAVFDPPVRAAGGRRLAPTLTYDGVRAFGDVYGVGAPLDPALLTGVFAVAPV